MTAREFDPFRLDVALFAKEAGTLDGCWPLVQFDRIVDSAAPEAPDASVGEVTWGVRGEQRQLRGGDPQTWMHLHAATRVWLVCQRCLKPVCVELQVTREFLFVHGEDAAAQLDADTEDDVLAITRALDLRELIEDELLLAMPIVPRHEVCPDPLPVAADDSVIEERPNPFAALAALKRTPLN